MEARLQGLAVEELPTDRRRVGPLRAASDFEHTFGRPALDDFLLQNLPDAQFLPGDLHHSLMSLPWSDVFTTNYDTLLERTCSTVIDRRYDVVVSDKDIPGSMKPRIVKLHGSFPSQRPFIFTEEDYRTYPRRFAPFVNMVQQSIMENAFCLLGFSGVDPNFLEWTGWVRDNLGDAAPLLYLIGALDLSPRDRHVLAKRCVTPVDLGPLFPKIQNPDRAARHRDALRWFLEELQRGTPPDPNDWPSYGLTPGAGTRRPSPGGAALSAAPWNPFGPMSAAELEERRASWEAERHRYPGWIVCPADARERLWRETKPDYERVVEGAVALPPEKCLSLLFELAWRMERIEAPAYEPLPSAAATAIQRVNPFPRLLRIDGALVPGEGAEPHIDWEELAAQWRELTVYAMRTARRSGDSQAFDRYWGWLDLVAQSSPALRAQLSWERCLTHLSSFALGEFAEKLERWTPTPGLPLWELRRGSLYAEFGDLDEAKVILSRALETTRSRLSAAFADRELLSLEGWIMAALRAASRELGAQPSDIRKYTRRWAQLERYEASPWDDIESMREALKGAPPPDAIVEMRKNFDPGSYSATARMSDSDHSFVAVQALGILERGGVPLRAGLDATFGHLAELAASQLVDTTPSWAVATLVRSQSSELLESAFSRPRVMSIAAEETGRLIRSGLDGLAESLGRLGGRDRERSAYSDLAWRFLGTLSELLSRTTLRMTAGDRDEALQLATRTYLSREVRQDRSAWKALQNFFRRLLDAMSDDELARALPALLSLPIPGELGFDKRPEPLQLWPEPFEGLAPRGRMNCSLPKARVAELVALVDRGDRQLRARAAFRLAWLHNAGLLSDSEVAFGEALWRETSPDTGLPAVDSFYPHAFLLLPAPHHIDKAGVVKGSWLRLPFPRLATETVLPDGRPVQSFGFPNKAGRHFESLIRMTKRPWGTAELLVWSPDEARALLDKAVGWWAKEETEIGKWLGRRRGELGSGEPVMDQFVELLSEVVTPFLDVGAAPAVLRLLDGLERHGIPVLTAQAALAGRGHHAAAEGLAKRIRASLAGDQEWQAENALDAVALWVLFGGEKGSCPADLLDELVHRVLARRHPGLRQLLVWLTVITNKQPVVLAGARRTMLEAALGFLFSETRVAGLSAESQSPFAAEERPDYRALAAGLAGAMFAQDLKVGASSSSVLRLWEAAGHDDPLPEVRRAWRGALSEAAT
jgi:tetratricopeptide (TPR) repeat protein